MSKYILISGSPVDGFEFAGPFETEWDTQAYAENNGYDDEGWWIAPLNTVESVELEEPVKPVEPKAPFLITTQDGKRSLREAVILMSEDGENPEYDRGLAEMLTRLLGKGDGHIPQVAKYLREAADYEKAMIEWRASKMPACANCDKPTHGGKYCSAVCEDMDKHPAPRDDMEKFTS